MTIPRRIIDRAGWIATVDDVMFELPINATSATAMFAVFAADLAQARKVLPAGELRPVRLWRSALVVFAALEYRNTDIGPYREFSLGIVCTGGSSDRLPLLPLLFRRRYRTGEYIFDIPVTTELACRTGKDIWGLPKHVADITLALEQDVAKAEYSVDGRLVAGIDVQRPLRHDISVNAVEIVDYSALRGLLFQSRIYLSAHEASFSVGRAVPATLRLGQHPLADALRRLRVTRPVFAAVAPNARGILDDYVESWFSAQSPTRHGA